MGIGVALAELGRVEEAIACYREGIRLQPTRAEAHVNLGNALHQQGKAAEAASCYREALRHKPDLWQANLNLGNVLSLLGKEEEAVPYFREAIRLRPDLTDAHVSLACLRANSRDMKLRDAAEAVMLARTAVERNPTKSSYLRMLGIAECRAENWKGAVKALEQALELGKDGDALAWLFLAMGYHQLGQKDQSRQSYDRAVCWIDAKQPKDEVYRRSRAEAAALLGIEDSNARIDKK
jgi:tetratricopeptide (TPR) repeat protein